MADYPVWLLQLVEAFIFIAPAYFANAVPVITSGLGPIDRGMKFFDGKRLLGKNKTIGGLLGGILAGEILWIAAMSWLPDFYEGYPFWTGFVMGFGTILGDATGSFVKRRINLPPGGPFPVMDQLGFVLMAYLLVWLAGISFPLWYLWYVIPITLLGHLGANYLAYLIGWKDVWW